MTTFDGVVADLTTHLGPPVSTFTDRETGIGVTSGWTWKQDRGPLGLRVERYGDRWAIRAYRHIGPGRRAELICFGEPTETEVRALCVLAGLLPDWGRP